MNLEQSLAHHVRMAEAYRDAYVTTANVNGREVEGSGAGALFRVNLGVQGRPEFQSKIGL